MTEIRFRRGAIESLMRDRKVARELEDTAEKVRDVARRGASRISATRPSAIVATDVLYEGSGPEVRVGYEKTHPGFVLFFHEVGTSDHPATPHLRPAIRGRFLS